MKEIISILILGVLLTTGNPISELKVNKPPTEEEARKLNHSDEEFEVFLNSNGKVEYRDYEYYRVKGDKLPFKIKPKSKESHEFYGKQINLKVKNGWLIGFDKGEWGGNLFWFNETGSQYKKITIGNIKDLFKINEKIYVIEGLAHLSISRGQIFKVEEIDGEWGFDKVIDLPDAPKSATLTKDDEFLIITSKGIVKVDGNFKINTLISKNIWWRFLYPNSILIEGSTIYVGMRGGVLRTQLNEIDSQEWLTKK